MGWDSAYRYVYDVNDIIGELSGVVGSQVVATALHEKQLAAKLGLKSF